jgi:MFS family permease
MMKGQIIRALVAVMFPILPALNIMTLVPALPAIAEFYGGGERGEWIGQVLIAVPGLGFIPGSMLSGVLVRKLGMRLTLSVSILAFITIGAACVAIDGWLGLLAARALVGGAAGVMAVAGTSIAAEFPNDVRDKLIGFSNGLGCVLSMVVLIASGWCVESWGWQSQSYLYLIAVPLVFTAVLVGADAPESGSSKAEERSTVAGLWPIYVLTIVATVGIFMSTAQWPFFLEGRGVTSGTTQASIMAVFTLAAAVSGWLYGYARRCVSARLILSVVFLTLGGSMVGLPSVLSVPWFFVLSAIAGVGAGLAAPVMTSEILDSAAEQARAGAVATLLSCMFIAQFLNPFLVNPLKHLLGVDNAFWTIGAAFVVAGLCFAAFKRSLSVFEISRA